MEKMEKKIKAKELQNYINNLKIGRPSKWKQSVKEDAVWLLDNFIESYGADATFSKSNLGELLNGAENWKQFSYSGMASISDSDIARHYCTKSELRKVGLTDSNFSSPKKPNEKESWLDVQARALYQASELIETAIEDLD